MGRPPPRNRRRTSLSPRQKKFGVSGASPATKDWYASTYRVSGFSLASTSSRSGTTIGTTVGRCLRRCYSAPFHLSASSRAARQNQHALCVRIGVYVDGFNMYYGARNQCGADVSGWRWVDIRRLIESALPSAWLNQGATISRVVYCTARATGHEDPDLPKRQDAYIRALEESGSVDLIEFGTFVRGLRTPPLAIRDNKRRPSIVTSNWPVMVKDSNRENVEDARFLVSHLHREEKGSDVNVATHLLLDVLQADVNAAIVVSNDSDLELPLASARERVPVGLLNPGSSQLAGRLKDDRTKGPGGHWWGRIAEADYFANQLPDPVGPVAKPADW